MEKRKRAAGKTLVFISHITPEKDIAIALKSLITKHFLNVIEVFVSSDPSTITSGSKWLEEITAALKRCEVEIILASPESVKRPWINFEGGAAWIQDIPVIPLCHSGMTRADLPAPLNSLQAELSDDEESLKKMFAALATAAGCNAPDVNFKEFIGVVEEYEKQSKQIKELVANTSVAPTDGLVTHEFETLVEIAEQTFQPGDGVSVYLIREALHRAGLQYVAITLAIQMLSRKDFLSLFQKEDEDRGGYFQAVMINDKGWSWLQANQDKLKLRREMPPRPGTRPSSKAASVKPIDDLRQPFDDASQTFDEGDIPF